MYVMLVSCYFGILDKRPFPIGKSQSSLCSPFKQTDSGWMQRGFFETSWKRQQTHTHTHTQTKTRPSKAKKNSYPYPRFPRVPSFLQDIASLPHIPHIPDIYGLRILLSCPRSTRVCTVYLPECLNRLPENEVKKRNKQVCG